MVSANGYFAGEGAWVGISCRASPAANPAAEGLDQLASPVSQATSSGYGFGLSWCCLAIGHQVDTLRPGDIVAITCSCERQCGLFRPAGVLAWLGSVRIGELPSGTVWNARDDRLSRGVAGATYTVLMSAKELSLSKQR